MKRVLTALFILLVSVLVLCACEEETCAHTFGDWTVVKAATCEEDGILERVCSLCQAKENTPIAKAGSHTQVEDAAVEATCTRPGKTAGSHCSACCKVLVAQTVVNATGHTEVTDEAVAPTCTEKGFTQGSHCSVCGEILQAQEEIAPLEHLMDAGETVTEATCIQAGEKKFSCTREGCDWFYTESYSLPTYTSTELYNRAVQYVCEITTFNKAGKGLSLGTGIVISDNGQILTNYHVIENAYSAQVELGDTKYAVISVLAYDKKTDLAVLKVNAMDLTPAVLCDLPVSAGSTVYAMGSSRGLTNTFSRGIVTYYNRVLDGVAYIQHDVSITHGNSGGPLINEFGEVIGINTSAIDDSQNLNFAVFAGEYKKLKFGTPQTLKQVYANEFHPVTTLASFITENGELSNGEYRLVLEAEDGIYVAFYYHPQSKDITLYHFLYIEDDNCEFNTFIRLNENQGVRGAYYYGTDFYRNNRLQGSVSGYIHADSFKETTTLTADNYTVPYRELTSCRQYVSKAAALLVSELQWLSENYLNLTLYDFGFTSFAS